MPHTNTTSSQSKCIFLDLHLSLFQVFFLKQLIIILFSSENQAFPHFIFSLAFCNNCMGFLFVVLMFHLKYWEKVFHLQYITIKFYSTCHANPVSVAY